MGCEFKPWLRTLTNVKFIKRKKKEKETKQRQKSLAGLHKVFENNERLARVATRKKQ